MIHHVELYTNDLKTTRKRYPYAGGKGYYALYFEDPMRMKVEVVAKNA
ncbi:MAG: hypothetical protein ACOCWO_01085 [Candidatus Muiribacteriaceae bacterium]